jgi:hypothetical protein
MENANNEAGRKHANDSWQAEVLGQIYDTNFAEMTQWIAEGALMPTDKVRRGNLRWLEAGKVPLLVPFFNAKASGAEPPPVVQTTVVEAAPPETVNFPAHENFQTPAAQPFPPAENFTENITPPPVAENRPEASPAVSPEPGSQCILHPETQAKFFCEVCANTFCPQCPKSYGGSVKICPMCGAMCRKIGEKDPKKEREVRYQQAISEGFGLKDIGNAFLHPFKYKASLFFGCLMYMFFTVGQKASAVGGIFLLFGALVCMMLAIMLSFGVLANTIENFSQGKLETDFMPGFDDFNLWDDVIHPFFLAIGASVSSFGPFILVLFIGFYLMFSSMTEQVQKAQTQPAKTESPFLIDEKKAMQQSDEVKRLLESVKTKADDKRALTEKGVKDAEVALAEKTEHIRQEEEEVEELESMIRQNRQQQLESVVGKTGETGQAEAGKMFSGILGFSLPLLILLAATLLWGYFYYPAACAVAGYTRSFRATINPAVGIDTIKHLGVDYLKIVGVFILLFIAYTVIGTTLNELFFVFNLPRLGNLPAIALTGIFSFYFIVVFSCTVGYALFKNADKFRFYRG